MRRVTVAMLLGATLLTAPAAADMRHPRRPPPVRQPDTSRAGLVERLPAPVAWGLMLGGFGLIGTVLRGQRNGARRESYDPWRI